MNVGTRDVRTGPAATEGTPYPLGVTWIDEERAYNFALYSRHAASVMLLLYGEHDVGRPIHLVDFDCLTNKSGRVWHCRIAKASVAHPRYYAYAVAGPAPASAVDWHHFDARKVLLVPYATSVFFLAAFDRASAAGPQVTPAGPRWGFCARASTRSTGVATACRGTRTMRSSTSCTSARSPHTPRRSPNVPRQPSPLDPRHALRRCGPGTQND